MFSNQIELRRYLWISLIALAVVLIAAFLVMPGSPIDLAAWQSWSDGYTWSGGHTWSGGFFGSG